MKLSIRSKIISGFMAIFIIGMGLAVYNLYSINKISKTSAEQLEIQEANSSILSVLNAHYVWRQNLSNALFNDEEFTGSYNSHTCALGEWLGSTAAVEMANDEIKLLLQQIEEPHAYIHEEARSLMDLMETGEHELAQNEFIGKVQPAADEVISILQEITVQYGEITKGHIHEMQSYQNKALLITAVLIVLYVVMSLVIAFMLIRSIMQPINGLIKAAEKVASGNLNSGFQYSVDDEIGKLSQAFAFVVGTFKDLISDINAMYEEQKAGNIDCFISKDKYNGDFQYAAEGINSMVNNHIQNALSILDITEKYAEGDFGAKLAPLPGKQVIANTVLDRVSRNLKDVDKSIMDLVESALKGELDRRVDDSGFKGGWKEIISGLNQLLEAVNEPLIETEKTLSLVSEGKLDVKMANKYNGQFAKMSNSINATIEILSKYIKEISGMLNDMASNNFNIEIKGEYVGSFSSIKASMEAIIDMLNIGLKETRLSAEQVAIGAAQISQTSSDLSQGTIEQASAVEQLNAEMEVIYAQTVKNAESVANANSLSSMSKQNAEQGNAEMSKMLNSMAEINTASQNISKIIKVIDDIAFQTNLLALNAAVEAARAGSYGKGFAVVSEEVRNLAAKSKVAASETAALIEESISKVNDGMLIANNTAAALSVIANNAGGLSEIINEIDISSKTQTSSILQINDGISHISQVTQENSATSQESAAAAEELSSQAEMLKAIVNQFRLKN